MQWQLGAGRHRGRTQIASRCRRPGADLRPGDVSFDATYHEARLLLAIGDTAQATQLLDLSSMPSPP